MSVCVCVCVCVCACVHAHALSWAYIYNIVQQNCYMHLSKKIGSPMYITTLRNHECK